MKAAHLCLTILLFPWSAAWAQEKPSLGPPPQAPSLSGPRSASTMDARRLLRVQKIFVEWIDNSLNEKLADGLSKMGRFRIVDNRDAADTVLRGSCSDLRRLKTVHAEVFLNDRSSGVSIWQDSVRRPFNPPPLEKVVNDTALLILTHLRDSIHEAQRK